MNMKLGDLGLAYGDKITKISTLAPIFCYENERVKDVVEKMAVSGYRRLAVVSKSKEVLGVLTRRDILDAFLRKEDLNQEVSNIMSRELIACNENDSIGHVLTKFKISRRGGFPVMSNNKLVGMVSERDMIKKMAGINTGIKVSDAMTKKPFFIRPGISILDCLRTMVNTRYRRLPVEEGSKLVGIVTTKDLLKYIHDEKFSFDALDEGIEKIMTKNTLTIGKDADLGEAVEKMVTSRTGGIIVTDDNSTLHGIITERDILEEIE